MGSSSSFRMLPMLFLAAAAGAHATPATLRFVALGDSYTIGEAVEPSERWPELLAKTLRERGLPLADPLIVARTGWTTDEMLAALAERGELGRFDLVTLMVGVNDQYRGRDAGQYRVHFIEAIDRAQELAGGEGGRVVVISVPDWGVMPFAEGRDRADIAAEVDAFNVVNREEARRIGARYVDVTALSRRAADDESLRAADGLHPSAAQHAQWLEKILPVVAKILDH